MGGMEILAKQVMASLGVNPDDFRKQLTEFFEGIRQHITHFDNRLESLEREVADLRASIDALISMHVSETTNGRYAKPGTIVGPDTGPGGTDADTGPGGTDADTGPGDTDTAGDIGPDIAGEPADDTDGAARSGGDGGGSDESGGSGRSGTDQADDNDGGTRVAEA